MTKNIPWPKDKLIAHRGASSTAPENTLPAFEKAAELGASWIEFDIKLSKDLEVMVFHDHILKRTSNGNASFFSRNSAFLRSLDAGSWFSDEFKDSKIPFFSEVIQIANDKKLFMNVELKANRGFEVILARQVVRQLASFYPKDQPLPLISSTSLKALKAIRDLLPGIAIGIIMDKWQKDWLNSVKNLGAISVHSNYKILTAERVREITRNGLQVLAYTVNDKDIADKLFAMGVTAVFTDDVTMSSRT